MSDDSLQAQTASFPWKVVARDTLLAVALSVLLALVTNYARKQPLAWVQSAPYEILVPCPELTGDPTEIPANSPYLEAPFTMVIDVRSPNDFAQWNVPGAQNQPFDWLGPPVDMEVQAIARELARTGAQRVVVYGDGEDPDSGREWARMLAGAHLKNIHYVSGGAIAIRKLAGNGKVAP
jgi:hypothetical protein